MYQLCRATQDSRVIIIIIIIYSSIAQTSWIQRVCCIATDGYYILKKAA
jgi:hypothetical protein